MLNEWPSSDLHNPVWIDEIPNAWGFYGDQDRTAYQVYYMGKPGELHTNYPDAAKEAQQLLDAHRARATSEE